MVGVSPAAAPLQSISPLLAAQIISAHPKAVSYGPCRPAPILVDLVQPAQEEFDGSRVPASSGTPLGGWRLRPRLAATSLSGLQHDAGIERTSAPSRTPPTEAAGGVAARGPNHIKDPGDASPIERMDIQSTAN